MKMKSHPLLSLWRHKKKMQMVLYWIELEFPSVVQRDQVTQKRLVLIIMITTPHPQHRRNK